MCHGLRRARRQTSRCVAAVVSRLDECALTTTYLHKHVSQMSIIIEAKVHTILAVGMSVVCQGKAWHFPGRVGGWTFSRCVTEKVWNFGPGRVAVVWVLEQDATIVEVLRMSVCMTMTLNHCTFRRLTVYL